MANVTATPANGVDKPMGHFAWTTELSGVVPIQDSIGEAVNEALRRASEAGFTIESPNFVILITFEV